MAASHGCKLRLQRSALRSAKDVSVNSQER